MKKYFSIALLLCTQLIYSQNWRGTVSADWNNSANWSSWPLVGDNITIDTLNYTGAKINPVISAASVFIPSRTVVQNGAVLTVNANFTTDERLEVLGAGTEIIINSGTLSVGPGNNGRFILSDGATAVMNGGNVIADQRLLVELGASFTMYSGQITAGETLALTDGDLNGSSRFTMYDGVIVTNSELAFENESGLFHPSFTMFGGTLTVNGDVSWFGTAPGAGTPVLNLVGGNTIISGGIMNLPLSTVNMRLNISNNADVQFSGALIDLNRAGDTLFQDGNSDLRLLSAHTINNNGAFISAANVYVNGNGIIQGSGSYQFGNISVATAKTLTHSSPSAIFVGGEWNCSGTFLPGTNAVVMNGSTAQQLSFSPAGNFYTLQLDNTAGVNFTGSTTVNSQLLLMRGIAYTTANALTIADNAIAAGANDSTYVSGPVGKAGDDAFEFPVGKNGKYRKIGILAPGDVSSRFVAEYFDEAYSDTVSLMGPLDHVSGIEYWNLQQQVTGNIYTAELFWNNADSSGIDSCTHLTIAQWNGSAWSYVPSVAFGGCSGAGSGSVIMQPGVTTSGPLTFATGMGVATAAADEEMASAIQVYPNPAGTNSMLSISNKAVLRKVVLNDNSGRLLLEHNTEARSLQIPMNYAPGIYVLRLYTEAGVTVKKIIIQ